MTVGSMYWISEASKILEGSVHCPRWEEGKMIGEGTSSDKTEPLSELYRQPIESLGE